MVLQTHSLSNRNTCIVGGEAANITGTAAGIDFIGLWLGESSNKKLRINFYQHPSINSEQIDRHRRQNIKGLSFSTPSFSAQLKIPSLDRGPHGQARTGLAHRIPAPVRCFLRNGRRHVGPTRVECVLHSLKTKQAISAFF